MGIVLAFYYKKEGPQREEHVWDDEEDEDDNDSDDPNQKPYWDVPEPDKDELTIKYHFKRR